MKINTDTKLVGLLGYPLSQSFSSIMQNAAFQKCNLNKIYIPIEVTLNNLEAVVKGMSKMNFDGFNITKPYKVDIMKYLDDIDEYARLIGAVNTVKISNGIMKGYNTDGTGFLRSFEEGTGEKIKGKNVFIMGSGGAARAIAITFALNNAQKIYISNRTYEKAVSLSADVNKLCNSVAIPMEYEDMKKAISNSHVLINTTSVGMYPNINESPIDNDLINKNLIVCDVVYNPRKTKLIEDAEKIGCKIIIGMHMFIYQGVEAFELWTGEKAPVELMYEIVNEGLL